MNFQAYFLFWFIFISAVAVVMTSYDKAAAKSKWWRVPEKVLMLTGFLGGATAMYAVMQIIRHKTKHKKFMVGLPVFILLHIAIIVFIFLYK